MITGNEMGDEKLTKKERKGRIAESFLNDDADQGYTNKKFGEIMDKGRRMGAKKRQLKDAMKRKRRKGKNN